jgi:arylsulfatase A-like enzyme
MNIGKNKRISGKQYVYLTAVVLSIALVILAVILLLYRPFKLEVWSEPQSKPVKTVILITVDTLRADHLSCYGYLRKTSPNIDLFAKDALVFENCLAHAPMTGASCSSILSGFYPHETKVPTNDILPKQIHTVAEILQSQGYVTIGVVSNYVLRSERGWDQGFQIFDDTMKQHELAREEFPERVAEYTTAKAVELLSKHCDKSLFMWIHYQDPHGPYTPPERFAQTFPVDDIEPVILKLNAISTGLGGIPSYQQLDGNRNLHHYISQYDAEIRYMDEQFGNLIATLNKHGLYDSSLIIFSADHGEGMGEHDYYFAHGENLYSVLTHIPLIIKLGNHFKGRSSNFVQHIDIMPTILKALGVRTNLPLRGYDLLGENKAPREIFGEMKHGTVIGRYKFYIAVDGMKLIYKPGTDKYELFNLKADPGEENDLINEADYKDLIAQLKTQLHRIRKEDLLKLPIVPEKEKQLTDEEIEKLKSLGYIQ